MPPRKRSDKPNSQIDPEQFGPALKRLRESRGLTQEKVAEKLRGVYSSGRAYRRIENEGNIPSRWDAIDIHVRGLGITDRAVINRNLSLLGYVEVTDAELRIPEKLDPLPPEPVSDEGDNEGGGRPWVWAIAVLLGSVAAAGLLSRWSVLGLWLSPIAAAVYAALYVVSLLLETAYEPAFRTVQVTVSVFCLMLLSTTVAMAVDSQLALAGTPVGLAAGFAIIVLSAGAQIVFTRRALPAYSTVPSRLGPMSGQTAHLKNTGYFLILAVLFLIVPLNAVAILRAALTQGDVSLVKSIVSEPFMVGSGVVSPNVGPLAIVLGLLFPLTLKMGSQLLDSLRTHPRSNEYTQLFYLRAILYFTLALLCLGWFAYWIGEIQTASLRS